MLLRSDLKTLASGEQNSTMQPLNMQQRVIETGLNSIAHSCTGPDAEQVLLLFKVVSEVTL